MPLEKRTILAVSKRASFYALDSEHRVWYVLISAHATFCEWFCDRSMIRIIVSFNAPCFHLSAPEFLLNDRRFAWLENISRCELKLRRCCQLSLVVLSGPISTGVQIAATGTQEYDRLIFTKILPLSKLRNILERDLLAAKRTVCSVVVPPIRDIVIILCHDPLDVRPFCLFPAAARPQASARSNAAKEQVRRKQ